MQMKQNACILQAVLFRGKFESRSLPDIKFSHCSPNVLLVVARLFQVILS